MMRRFLEVSFAHVRPTPLPGTEGRTGPKMQEPNHRSICRALRRNFHWKCFVLTVMIDGCLAVVFWCQLFHFSYSRSKHIGPGENGIRSGPCDQGYNFIPVAFAVMLYVVYIMECWHCRTRLDLMCQVDISTVYDFVNSLREALPIVWWRAVCYHYIRRTRQVTRYRNGDAITTTQVYYERVNSHNSGSVFLYHDCGVRDISKKLVSLERYPVTKVRFSKGFVFANLQAANEFEEQRARFFQENEQRDDYMEVREGLDLSSLAFKESMIAFSDPTHRPWYTSQPAFWILSLLLFSWPLRVLVEYKTAYVHYQVTKLFGTNYLSPSSQNYTGPLTRTSTMDSRDLEAAMQANNYVIVPSYSEALLMDPVNTHAHVVHDRQGNLHIETRQRWRRGGNGESQDGICNENVIPNYGALIHEGHPLIYSQRSRSMSFLRPRSGSGPNPVPTTNGNGPNHQLPAGAIRSVSIGSLANFARGVYRTLPSTPEGTLEEGGEIPEEPPPPYEVALRMCAPFYQRLRRSATSLQRLAQRLPLSRSSSKVNFQPTSSEGGGPSDADTLL